MTYEQEESLRTLCKSVTTLPWWWDENLSCGGGWDPEDPEGQVSVDGHIFSDGTTSMVTLLAASNDVCPLWFSEGVIQLPAATYIEKSCNSLPQLLEEIGRLRLLVQHAIGELPQLGASQQERAFQLWQKLMHECYPAATKE